MIAARTRPTSSPSLPALVHYDYNDQHYHDYQNYDDHYIIDHHYLTFLYRAHTQRNPSAYVQAPPLFSPYPSFLKLNFEICCSVFFFTNLRKWFKPKESNIKFELPVTSLI